MKNYPYETLLQNVVLGIASQLVRSPVWNIIADASMQKGHVYD